MLPTHTEEFARPCGVGERIFWTKDLKELSDAFMSITGKEKLMSKLVSRRTLYQNIREIREVGRGSTGKALLVEYKGVKACLKLGNKPMVSTEVYLREAIFLERLNGAGGAPRLLLAANDYPCLLITYCPYPSLKTLIESNAFSTRHQLLNTFQSAAFSLHRIHEAGLVHGDFKHDNILISFHPGTPVKTCVIDFGLSVPVGKVSPGYVNFNPEDHKKHSHIAYELWCGDPARPSADVYTLGYIMKWAFHRVATLRRFPIHQPALDSAIGNLIASMLNRCHHQRPTMKDIAFKLGNLMCRPDTQVSEGKRVLTTYIPPTRRKYPKWEFDSYSQVKECPYKLS